MQRLEMVVREQLTLNLINRLLLLARFISPIVFSFFGFLKLFLSTIKINQNFQQITKLMREIQNNSFRLYSYGFFQPIKFNAKILEFTSID